MQKNYDRIIEQRAERVFNIMKVRVTPSELERLRAAFNLARKAHANQKRKTGEPYILHPIAVATIAAEELRLGANPVIACFLHDVVEDTDYTLEEIERRFGADVAFLVKVVTKQKKDKYEMSKQLDNFKQMLVSVQYDIRALLVKLADRLHNMRTLSSMRPDKQMKIAGETDYFYAPLANRLGLYKVKTELENLSFKFRCPHEYSEIAAAVARDEAFQHERLELFCDDIRAILRAAGVHAEVYVEYRQPYSLWRKMHKYGDDFNHLKYRHFTDVVFEAPRGVSEKDMALKIYSMLTDRFKEKPGGIVNYIDSPKENGYQSFHVKLMADFGRWQEVHISSRRMVRDSQLGCVADRREDNIARWIEKFRSVLRDIAEQSRDSGGNFIEKVVTSFYNDDIMTFTPKGEPVVLPQRSTVIDFAYDISPELGNHAKCARINNNLASVKTRLHRGDVVEVITAPELTPARDWLQNTVTYKAKKSITEYFDSLPVPVYNRCTCCNPMPGEEVVGYREADGRITIHKRDCPTVIRLATQQGDNIVSVNYESDGTLYPVTMAIKAVDRVHLFVDLVDSITNEFNLSIDSIHADTVDSIVNFEMSFSVHSFGELQAIMRHIGSLDGVDEVRRINAGGHGAAGTLRDNKG
ncbi:MAG: HD domain-containing protein [Muribaculaceae bacterium]|nr:HD domain-containing protein [Muribaculaceae bacterium]